MTANRNPQRPLESERPLAEENDGTARQPEPDESELANIPASRDEFEYQRRLFFGR